MLKLSIRLSVVIEHPHCRVQPLRRIYRCERNTNT